MATEHEQAVLAAAREYWLATKQRSPYAPSARAALFRAVAAWQQAEQAHQPQPQKGGE